MLLFVCSVINVVKLKNGTRTNRRGDCVTDQIMHIFLKKIYVYFEELSIIKY